MVSNDGQATQTMHLEFSPVRTKKDMSDVATLAGVIWRQHYTPIIGASQVEYMLETFQSTEAIRQSIETEQYEYYLLHIAGKSAGYLAYKMDQNEKSLFISKFYLADAYRGRGFARIMLNFILEHARQNNVGYLWLTVNKHNTNAISAYEKLGFENKGSIIQDIGHGYRMDDFRMIYTL